MTINLKSKLSKPLEKIWKEFKKESFCTYTPHALAELKTEGLVFIGINPSLPRAEEERSALLGGKPHFGDESNMNHKYFKKFFEIGTKTKLSWSHLDIFYMRETNQNALKKLLRSETGRDFLNQQWQLTKSILDPLLQDSKKRIFVVNNALARDIIISKINGLTKGYVMKFDEEIGTYTYKNNIFFFTSMLTGQRALDTGSFERLVWHINQVKE